MHNYQFEIYKFFKIGEKVLFILYTTVNFYIFHNSNIKDRKLIYLHKYVLKLIIKKHSNLQRLYKITYLSKSVHISYIYKLQTVYVIFVYKNISLI